MMIMKKNNFNLVVIIPTCNRPQLVADCLDSLKKQSIEIEQILVIDQSDNLETKAVCEKYNLEYIHKSFKNKSLAVNYGIENSDSEYIAVVDDDVILAEDWAEIARDCLQNENYSIVQGQIIAGEVEGELKESRLNDVDMRRQVYRKNIITPIFKIGCNFVFSRSVLDKVGLFDTLFGPGARFPSSDDNDWGYRLLNLGIKALYEPRLKLTHQSWRDEHADLKQMSEYGYSLGAFLAKIKMTSKLDFIYHLCAVEYWLLKNTLFSFKSKKVRKPFQVYKTQFHKGLFDYSKSINSLT